jgi:hypothetical protein
VLTEDISGIETPRDVEEGNDLGGNACLNPVVGKGKVALIGL